VAGAALPDGRRALSASADKTLKLWDLETGNPLAAFTADSDLFAVAVAANDRFVAGSHDGRLHILRHLTCHHVARQEVHKSSRLCGKSDCADSSAALGRV